MLSVRSIITKNTKDQPRSFFDNIDKWAKDEGGSGLAYFSIVEKTIIRKRSYWEIFSEDSLKEIMRTSNAKKSEIVFF